jgi:DNA repair photolyase
MIISASRRSDVPAFFGDWLMNRLRAGEAAVVNPFNASQVRRVNLEPDQVDVLVFWTKNPAPFMRNLDELDAKDFNYYFLFTLNQYPKFLEPGLPPLKERLDIFRALSRRLGPGRVIWRYDPIVISSTTTPEYHRRNFASLAKALQGCTNRVVISFMQTYAKLKPRLKRAEANHGVEFVDFKAGEYEGELRLLSGQLAHIANSHGLEMRACAEKRDLSKEGIKPSACIDAGLINRLFGLNLPQGRDPHQRGACGCAPSVDIGAYNTCSHACLYCYANASPKALAKNLAAHDPQSPCLAGWPPEDGQAGLFDQSLTSQT